jgi:heme-degrading monooxygenase HmoA
MEQRDSHSQDQERRRNLHPVDRRSKIIVHAIGAVQEQVIPAAKQMRGFQGMLALADRTTGKMVGITLWETEDALRESEEAASQLRSDTAGAGGADVVSVERFEVVVDETG